MMGANEPQNQTSQSKNQPEESENAESSRVSDTGHPTPPRMEAKSVDSLLLQLAKRKLSEWPSIPELALALQELLAARGIDGYDHDTLEMLSRPEKARNKLEVKGDTNSDRREDLSSGLVPHAPPYDRLSRSPLLSEDLRIFPVPQSHTGERLVLVLEETDADNPGRFLPRLEYASGEPEDVSAMMAMMIVLGDFLKRRSLQDEKSVGAAGGGDKFYMPIDWVIRTVRNRMDGLAPEKKSPERCKSMLDSAANSQMTHASKFILALLRYRRQDFDDLPFEEQLGILEKFSAYLKNLFDAVRSLESFLDYGTPGRNTTPRIKDAEADLQMSLDHDVLGWSQTKVAEFYGINLSQSDKLKGGSSTVAQSIRRGRKLLEETLGKEKWGTLKQELRDRSGDVVKRRSKDS